ncbi:hypothetical protein HC891_27380, partial [Candidatus Gracilibacteria bacterium]|nr:hypothetical protein [Candidatus Gracilibacteria bacterium]
MGKQRYSQRSQRSWEQKNSSPVPEEPQTDAVHSVALDPNQATPPVHPTARRFRQNRVQQLQQSQGNAYVSRFFDDIEGTIGGVVAGAAAFSARSAAARRSAGGF